MDGVGVSNLTISLHSTNHLSGSSQSNRQGGLDIKETPPLPQYYKVHTFCEQCIHITAVRVRVRVRVTLTTAVRVRVTLTTAVRVRVTLTTAVKVRVRVTLITAVRVSQSQSYFAIDSLSVSTSWCRAHSGTYDQMLFSFRRLMSEVCCLVSFLGALSDERSDLSTSKPTYLYNVYISISVVIV
jgi:hypothetical protein